MRERNPRPRETTALPRPKADVFRRIVAYVIDVLVAGLAALIISAFFPPLGPVVSAAYLLFKDGLMFAVTKQDSWRNKSVGKRLLNLEVVSQDGATVDLWLSAKRNLTLVIGAVLELTIFASPLAAMIGLVIGLIEVFLLISEPYGRRLGDQWAHTQVANGR